MTPYGGNYVQSTVNQSALDIQAQRHEVIVITGAECGYTQARARKQSIDLKWQEAPGTPNRLIGEDKNMRHDAEKAVGLGQPIQAVSVVRERAAPRAPREHSGASEAHLRVVGSLQRCGEFESTCMDSGTPHRGRNPHAVGVESTSVVSVSEADELEQQRRSSGGADHVLGCRGEAVRRSGRSLDLSVGRHRCARSLLRFESRQSAFVTGIRIAGARCLELAGVTTKNLDHVDLYSCFPVAVQVAAAELGLDERRPLTVTGGLTFGGGPLNNYVMHSIARMAEVLRGDRDARGLVTANGGYLTKHAFGVYSSQPPTRAFRHEDLQPQVDETPQRDVADGHRGAVDVESYTVMYGAAGPSIAHVALSSPRRSTCVG